MGPSPSCYNRDAHLWYGKGVATKQGGSSPDGDVAQPSVVMGCQPKELAGRNLFFLSSLFKQCRGTGDYPKVTPWIGGRGEGDQ